VNAGERPLGLYVFGKDEAETGSRARRHDVGRRVRERRRHAGRPALARLRRGRARAASAATTASTGFREFSNPRGVVVRGEGDLIDAFYPPYGDTLGAITSAAFGQAPGSV
jgi:coniferyl-aldehyde dehydrogenase